DLLPGYGPNVFQIAWAGPRDDRLSGGRRRSVDDRRGPARRLGSADPASRRRSRFFCSRSLPPGLGGAFPPESRPPRRGLSLASAPGEAAAADDEQSLALDQAARFAGADSVQGAGRPRAGRIAPPTPRREEGREISADPHSARRPGKPLLEWLVDELLRSW